MSAAEADMRDLALTAVPAAVAPLIDELLIPRIAAAAAIAPSIGAAARELGAFIGTGGKRVRPTLVWAGYRVGGAATDPDTALRVATATEFLQACALVHDDVIDESATRRGNPTVHTRFAEAHRSAGWHGAAAHYGESVAILLGDLALAWADDIVVEELLNTPEVLAHCQPIWRGMRTEVLGGQLLDIRNEASGDESPTAAQQVMRYKTAAYTTARPLELGAALAGASAAVINQLGRAGVDLGIAFQLRDDVLGAVGNPEQTGKPSGDDLRTGKRTTLLADALRASDSENPSAASTLRSLVGTDLTDAQLVTVRTILADSGALDRAEERIAAHLQTCLATLATVPGDTIAIAELSALATAISQRQT